MDTSNDPSPPPNLGNAATMENALQFVSSYLNFAGEIPARAQKRVSLYKELQAATGENIATMKEMVLKCNGIASVSDFNILAGLMEETKQMNQEKMRLAAEIEEIVTEGAFEVEARRKELVESKNEREATEAEPEIVQAEPESPARRTRYQRKRVSMLPKKLSFKEELERAKKLSLEESPGSLKETPEKFRDKKDPYAFPKSPESPARKKKKKKRKRRKLFDNREVNSEGEEIYCWCRKPSHGGMVGCDGSDCRYECIIYNLLFRFSFYSNSAYL